MTFPIEFTDRVYRIFGERGRAWLPHLPDILDRCRDKWGLSAGAMCPDMRMNYIEFTTTPDGEPVALKVGVPHSELYTEMEALRLYAGRGSVRLLAADAELGAILMQRLVPGTMLWQLGDDREMTRIAAGVMRDLPVPVPDAHGFPRFSRWVERAFRLTRTEWDPEERMPRDLVDAAEAAFRQIERDATDEVVLHGDLHHENILFDDESGWTAIDPKGAVGPSCLELGRFVQNQLPSSLAPERRDEIVAERVQILSDELGLTQETVVASALVDCVLSHCWGFEDEEVSAEWYLGIGLGRTLCRMLGA